MLAFAAAGDLPHQASRVHLCMDSLVFDVGFIPWARTRCQLPGRRRNISFLTFGEDGEQGKKIEHELMLASLRLDAIVRVVLIYQ